MNYAIAIHKDAGSDYGVTVPDLPGCFSAGHTIDDAIAQAKEAIELHLEGIVEDGGEFPEPRSIEAHKAGGDYEGATWAMVAIDPSVIPQKARRINITVPERVLLKADRFASDRSINRSHLITISLVDYMRGREGHLYPTNIGYATGFQHSLINCISTGQPTSWIFTPQSSGRHYFENRPMPEVGGTSSEFNFDR